MQDLPKYSIPVRIFRRTWLQFTILAVILSGHVLLEFIPDEKKHPTYPKIISFCAVWITAWIFSRITTVFKEAPLIESKLAPNLRPVVFVLLRMSIYGLSFLFALDALGISISPLLASLGVGSLAVGLALQDTLGNLFSGFYLYVDRPIAIGDWIRLENGTEGQIVAIGWRSTHLLIPQENMVVIPNSKISSSAIVNLSLPYHGMSLVIPLGVAYDADLEKVERTLIETANRVADQMVGFFERDVPPAVRFGSFADSSINLNLSVKVRSFPDLSLVRHELIKEIKATFAREGIEIPYPKRVIQQMTIPQGLD